MVRAPLTARPSGWGGFCGSMYCRAIEMGAPLHEAANRPKPRARTEALSRTGRTTPESGK